jgi:pimeloyl-ACP methyl ester carboxylesterase
MKNQKIKHKVKRYSMITIFIIAALLLLLIIGGIIGHYFVYTPKFKDAKGNVISGSIAEFRRIKLGGYSHGVLIRGKSLENPMLLFLHCGPGVSETGIMRNFNSVLENYYTIVYMDQRGGGKSYSPFMDYKTFNSDQLVNDIHELTLYLKKEFKKEKILMLGHSFGAGFGAMAAALYPEDYSAFIGIGQPVKIRDIDSTSYSWVVDQAKTNNNNKALDELKIADLYWTKTDQKGYFNGMMINKKWVGYYGGQLYGKHSFVPFIFKNLLSKEYTVFDYLPYMLGMSKSGPASWEIMIKTDLKKQAPAFKCPFILFTGSHDYNAVPALIKMYFNSVDAPLKKMYWFEKSAHFPHFEEKELFQKIMVREILPLVTKN